MEVELWRARALHVTGENSARESRERFVWPCVSCVWVCEFVFVWQIKQIEWETMCKMWMSERAGRDLRQHPWICVCRISENGRDFRSSSSSSRIIINTSQPASQSVSQSEQLLVLLLLLWYSLARSLVLSSHKTCVRVHSVTLCVLLYMFGWFFLFHVKDNRMYGAISKGAIPSQRAHTHHKYSLTSLAHSLTTHKQNTHESAIYVVEFRRKISLLYPIISVRDTYFLSRFFQSCSRTHHVLMCDIFAC